MKYFSYLNTAATITGLYRAQQPFHLYIKDFFRQHKKYGSADRKQITHLCYCYFRLGKSLSHLPATEKILAALFVCSERPNDLLAHIKPAWNAQTQLPVTEKCRLAGIAWQTGLVFPATGQLSSGILQEDFILSHFSQPDVFLRIRPGQRQAVLTKLGNAQIDFLLEKENCIRLPPTTKIDGIVEMNKEVVVQDHSSQRTGGLLSLAEPLQRPVKIWDCCAASGGKSILAKDILGDVDLTVSDIRESVLINLKKRFAEAGLRKYALRKANLAATPAHLIPGLFDLIIADVPCSGSGTWGRNPERLLFFDEKEMETYRQLQQKIVSTILPSLANGGSLLYITCSVFKRENEDIVAFIQENFAVELVRMEVLEGYRHKADTMFAALLKKK